MKAPVARTKTSVKTRQQRRFFPKHPAMQSVARLLRSIPASKGIHRNRELISTLRKIDKGEKKPWKATGPRALSKYFAIENSRRVIPPEFKRALPRKFNIAKNSILANTPRTRNREVGKILRSTKSLGNIQNILIPINSTNRGGVSPSYFHNSVGRNPYKYAIISKSSGRVKGLALARNNGQNRYLNILGGFPGYGYKMLQKVIDNARVNGKKGITLSAVPQPNVNNANNKLVQWYQKQGFKINTSKPPNNTSKTPGQYRIHDLVPMRLNFLNVHARAP